MISNNLKMSLSKSRLDILPPSATKYHNKDLYSNKIQVFAFEIRNI